MTDPKAGPSKAATGIAATLPLLFSAVSCCVLPIAATGDPDQVEHFVQEMGVWFYVIAGVGAFSAVVCAVLMGLAARGKRIPAVITLFFAGLPWLAGLAGTTASIGVATSAVAYADPSMRAVLMAQGIAEASTAKLMGAWIGGALLSAVGLGWAFAALGQKAPERRGIGAMLAVAATLPVLGLVGFAYLGAGMNALVLALPGLSLLVGAGMAAAGAGEDAPRYRSGAMAAAAPVALGLAFVATTVAVHTGAIIEIFGAIAAVASESKMQLVAEAAEELAPVNLVATWGALGMLLPVAAVGMWAATRGKLSGGRIVGAVLALLLAASLPAADVLVNLRTGEALASASSAPWDGVEGFTPIEMTPSGDYTSPDMLLLADGRVQRVGDAAPTERAGVLAELVAAEDAPSDPYALARPESGPSATLAIAASTPAGVLREVLGELRAANATSLSVAGTLEGSLTEAQRRSIQRNAPMLALLGEPVVGVTVQVGARQGDEGMIGDRVLTATVGAEPATELVDPSGGPSVPLHTAPELGRLDTPTGIAVIVIGDGATAGSVFRTASLAAARGLEPVLVANEEELSPSADLEEAGAEEAEGTLALLGTAAGGGSRAGTLGVRGRADAAGDSGDRVGGARATTPVVRGSLSSDVVRRVVRSHVSEVRACYEQVLRREPSLAGTVHVRFVIAPTGEVQSAEVQQSDLGSRTVERCITQAVRRWRFPSGNRGGVVMVTYPFVFQSS